MARYLPGMRPVNKPGRKSRRRHSMKGKPGGHAAVALSLKREKEETEKRFRYVPSQRLW